MNQPIVLANYKAALQPAVALFKDNPLITKVHIFDPLKHTVIFEDSGTFSDPIQPSLYIRCNMTVEAYQQFVIDAREVGVEVQAILIPYRDERDESQLRYQAHLTLCENRFNTNYEGGDANED